MLSGRYVGRFGDGWMGSWGLVEGGGVFGKGVWVGEAREVFGGLRGRIWGLGNKANRSERLDWL